ncbi:MAG: hypothetical protein J5732_05475 [Bacteroidaceae bacterium]|nr:hypothetical protein [Bacteroidaceae bacterium]
MKKRSVFSLGIILLLSPATVIMAQPQGDLPYNIIGDPSGTAPYFFGPYAFPVPDILKNTVKNVTVGLTGEYTLGSLTPAKDHTAAVGFSVRLPLWTDRANLSVYGQFHEWYRDTPESRIVRRVSDKYALDGHCAGDVYVSIDMRLLSEKKYVPLVTLRAALKTASGDDYEKARYFDAPGYHFDMSVTKTFHFIRRGFFRSVSASLNTGFLCWQTDIGCQNDAWMFAGSVQLNTKAVNLSVDVGGYYGREKYYDSPQSLKVIAEFLPDKAVSPLFIYQKGLKDWPFEQFKIGLTYTIPSPKGLAEMYHGL